MKKYIIYIVGAVLLILGLAIGLCGMALVGFDTDILNGKTPYEERFYETDAENITGIRAEDINVRIEVVPSADEQIHIRYFENNKMRYTITEEGGTLTLVKRDTRRWYEQIALFDFSVFDQYLKIEIPADSPAALSLQTTNGSVKADGVSPASLTISTTNGRIDLHNVSTRGITLKTSNGSVSLDACSAADFLTANSSNGKMTINGVSTPRMTLKTSNAMISLEDVTTEGTLSAETSNGTIVARRVRSGADVTLESSNGRIEFEKIEFEGELYLKTSNARVEGTLFGDLGDYRYECKTSNGTSSLPSGGGSGPKLVRIKTSNADIRVSFDANAE